MTKKYLSVKFYKLILVKIILKNLKINPSLSFLEKISFNLIKIDICILVLMKNIYNYCLLLYK